VLIRKFKIENEKVEEFVALVRRTGNLVTAAGSIRLISDDPSDDQVVATAVSAQADLIITGDHHLLRIKKYQNIRIIKAAEFLKTYLEFQKF